MPAITAVQSSGQQELRAIWRSFAASRSDRERDRLALIYLPFVNYVANRLHSRMPGHVDRDDLVSDGLLGLIEAIDRFDPEAETKFETFAQRRIEGAMLDGVRSADWAPRSLRSAQRKIDAEIARQSADGPVDRELVARNVGMTISELDEAEAAIGRSNFHHLDAQAGAVEDDSGTLYDLIENVRAADPEHEAERNERLELLVHAIDCLPERELVALMLFDFEELPLAEIASILGVTESRVSQLRGQALSRIGTRLTGLAGS